MRRWKTAALAATGFLAVLVTERPCPALTGTDLAGNSWVASYASGLRVTGQRLTTDTTSGGVAFSETGTFTATEDDDGTMRTYTGTWRLTNRGRRLRCRLDAAGRTALRSAIVDWIYAEANDGAGPPLTNLRLRLLRANFVAAKVPVLPGPFTLRLGTTGVGTGRVGRRRVAGAVVHNVRISLTPE